MIYEPIYNPHLDRVFHKRIGRNSNPLRFGLTRHQVEELKTLGQWMTFLRRWNEKRSRYLASNRLNCVVCGSSRRGGITVIGQKLCSDCCNDIKESMLDD